MAATLAYVAGASAVHAERSSATASGAAFAAASTTVAAAPLNLADSEPGDHDAQRSRNRGGCEHAAHAEASDDGQRQQRAGDGAGGIHGLNQAVGRAERRFVDRLGHHHIAGGATHAFGKTVAKTNPQDLPPRRNQRQQRLYRVGHEVSADHDGLAARNIVGQVSGKKLGKGSHAFGDAFDDAKLRGPGAERCEKSGQHPVRHFAGRVVEKRSQAEGIDIAGDRSGTWRQCVHVSSFENSMGTVRTTRSSYGDRTSADTLLFPSVLLCSMNHSDYVVGTHLTAQREMSG